MRPNLIPFVLLLGLLLGSTAMADREKDEMHAKLKRIVIPKVAFEEATLRQVFAFLGERAKDLDIEGEGVNLMFACEDEALDQEVTMELDGVPLGELIRYICMTSGLHYRVEPHAVVIADGTAEKERMEMRVFYMEPGVLRSPHKKGSRDFASEDE